MKKSSFGFAGKLAGFASAVIAGVVGNLVFDYALHRDFFHPFRVERPARPAAAAAVRLPMAPAALHVTSSGLALTRPTSPAPPPIAVDTPPAPKPAPVSLPTEAKAPKAPAPLSATPIAAAKPPAPTAVAATPPPSAAAATPYVAGLPSLRLPDPRPSPPPHPGPGNGGLY